MLFVFAAFTMPPTSVSLASTGTSLPGSWLQVRPRKKHVQPETRQLTQEELLAEAAQTEIDNAKSLQVTWHLH